MAFDASGEVFSSLFQLVKSRAYCQVAQRVDATENPTPHMCILRVLALFKTGDQDRGFVRLAQLLGLATQQYNVEGAVDRWIHANRRSAFDLEIYLTAINDFYRTWDAKIFWLFVTSAMKGREMEFIAAILGNQDTGFRIIVAVGDAMKIRGDKQTALSIYISMCQVKNTPSLRSNVFELAMDIDPQHLPWLLQTFSKNH